MLAGVPTTVTDPLNLLVYAVHPYPDASADESGWDTDFGAASQPHLMSLQGLLGGDGAM